MTITYKTFDRQKNGQKAFDKSCSDHLILCMKSLFWNKKKFAMILELNEPLFRLVLCYKYLSKFTSQMNSDVGMAQCLEGLRI